MNNDCAGWHGCCVRLCEQLLNPSLGLVVLALAEVLVAHLAGGIDEVVGRPVFIVECVPDGVVAVERDGIRDGKLLHGLLHVGHLLLEVELRRVDANDHQAAVLVLLRPGADVGNGAQAVDAGVGPEVDEDDLSFELLRGQRRRVDPAGRAGEAVERGAANNAGGVPALRAGGCCNSGVQQPRPQRTVSSFSSRMQQASGLSPVGRLSPIRLGAHCDPARRAAFGPMPRWELDAAGSDVDAGNQADCEDDLRGRTKRLASLVR